MINKKLVTLLVDISLTLFRKNFFGIYHGSISSKTNNNSFVINTKDAIFDKMQVSNLCELKINSDDYSWKVASIEANIHNLIYTNIHEAKYIVCGMPSYTTAYALEHDNIMFEDYFGKMIFGKLEVYDPKDFSTWYSRNQKEIVGFLKKSTSHLMIIRGIGVYAYDRDMNELIKKVAILENSCRLLALKSTFIH
ncbi:FIG00388190: hypothetical protein [hydrothermal vent metagenome]|uniref:Class II aldolase/adducin N-terminal domain-containing protein n=1 Tax=hydrothermal vent metagenome TaxID=652676 RepID=A0A3B1E297_9ZZZZ